MTVKITQMDDFKGKIVLRIEGKLLSDDADLLEQTFEALETSNGVEIDMSGITFIDSDSASVIKRLEQKGLALSGANFFIRTVIETQKKTKQE